MLSPTKTQPPGQIPPAPVSGLLALGQGRLGIIQRLVAGGRDRAARLIDHRRLLDVEGLAGQVADPEDIAIGVGREVSDQVWSPIAGTNHGYGHAFRVAIPGADRATVSAICAPHHSRTRRA